MSKLKHLFRFKIKQLLNRVLNLKLGLFPRTIFNISNLENWRLTSSNIGSAEGGNFSDVRFIWSGFDFAFGRERLYWFCFSDPNSVEGLAGSIIHYHIQVEKIQDPRYIMGWKYLHLFLAKSYLAIKSYPAINSYLAIEVIWP